VVNIEAKGYVIDKEKEEMEGKIQDS